MRDYGFPGNNGMLFGARAPEVNLDRALGGLKNGTTSVKSDEREERAKDVMPLVKMLNDATTSVSGLGTMALPFAASGIITVLVAMEETIDKASALLGEAKAKARELRRKYGDKHTAAQEQPPDCQRG